MSTLRKAPSSVLFSDLSDCDIEGVSSDIIVAFAGFLQLIHKLSVFLGPEHGYGGVDDAVFLPVMHLNIEFTP